MKAALDPEARYLDHERVIRELDEAERDHELDAAGVIERLKDAASTCQSAVDRYTIKATEDGRARDAYIIARGNYLAEIKRRVMLYPTKERKNRSLDRPGWLSWCSANGVGHQYADICIAAANGDMARVTRLRRENNERAKQRNGRPALLKIKSLWERLVPEEREEFIRWALSGQDEAKAQKQRSSGRRVSSAEQLTQAQA